MVNRPNRLPRAYKAILGLAEETLLAFYEQSEHLPPGHPELLSLIARHEALMEAADEIEMDVAARLRWERQQWTS